MDHSPLSFQSHCALKKTPKQQFIDFYKGQRPVSSTQLNSFVLYMCLLYMVCPLTILSPHVYIFHTLGRTQLFHSCQRSVHNHLGNWHFIFALTIHKRNERSMSSVFRVLFFPSISRIAAKYQCQKEFLSGWNLRVGGGKAEAYPVIIMLFLKWLYSWTRK